MAQKSRSTIVPSICNASLNASIAMQEKTRFEQLNGVAGSADQADIDVDMREVYFLIMKLLSAGPFQRTSEQFLIELLEHQLLPRRYHAWFSRSGAHSGTDDDDGISLPLSYNKLVERYPHIDKDHLVKLLKQVLLAKARERIGRDASVLNAANLHAPNAADVPTLLGSGSYSLLNYGSTVDNKQGEPLPTYLRWPHMQADQVRGLSLREIGGGFGKHHRSPSIRSACYAIAKPSMIVQKMQNIKKLRGHRIAVYCAIFDRSGRYVITGSDDRLVKIWSMETAFCLASCRGHEGDITDLAVSSNNVMVASASNDFVIRVWRLADGMPISVLRGHTGAVTAIAFSPRPTAVYQLLSSSDDGTCRIWDARNSQCSPRVYQPKPLDANTGKSSGPSNNGHSSNMVPSHQILCCAYNANGTVFVTGSSDTLSRVWSACKPNTDDPDQPIHELDVLAGHENDVNYVQFSGCAVPSRPAVSDILKEDNVPKFKNSWFCHDYIVTCSRDGSAIIWKPRSRRSHGKEGRWIKSYHLKVPPPPLPPQPPRGGPRQRFLPTPRGVNMIVWSLDNRFVLAAIMDCRICVWNAADGSLVHSLTGHSASSYVLDVHPFNPRIAMSAGYDGKTIIWDIWEGVPIQIYEIGRFKLVDGKFSPDGTSIVLSDEVGQIYLLNTGQGEAQKDAKYDQFYLGDYRPLIRDSLGNVLDQETQLPPHRRNVQDLLCDSSMIPYPEPYQSMFQKRRLGALGIEWHPSSIKLAVGPDISLGQDFGMPLLEDLERMIEPPPEFIDAMYWEPENEALSDRNDSEYNAAEEYSTDGEPETLSTSSSDTEGSSEDIDADRSRKDGRRLRRRKHEIETKVESMTFSRRCVKKRNFNECEGSMSRTKRKKKSKSEPKASKRKSNKAKSLRPQRVAARNARNMLSQISGTSTDGDAEVDPADDSSSSELLAQDSSSQYTDNDGNVEHLHQKYSSQGQSCADNDELKSCKPVKPLSNSEGRKRIVLKFSLRDSKKPDKSEDGTLSTQNTFTEIEEKNLVSHSDFASSSANGDHLELSDQERIDSGDRRQGASIEDELQGSMGTEWGKMRLIVDSLSNFGQEQLQTDNLQEPCNKMIGDFAPTPDEEEKSSLVYCKLQHMISLNHSKESIDREDKDWSCSGKQSDRESHRRDPVGEASCSPKLEKDILPKIPKVKIKTPNPFSKRHELPLDGNDQNIASRLRRKVTGSKSKDLTSHRDNSWSGTCSSGDVDAAYVEDEASDAMNEDDSGKDLDYCATTRRTRSAKMKFESNLREPDSFNHKSEHAETSKISARSRFRRSRYSNNRHEDQSILMGRKSNHSLGKLPWLMLPEQEEAFRYIPQLGDIVVYFRQGHEECIRLGRLTGSGPWNSNKGYLSPAEMCRVESLAYGNFPGSGEACCKMILRFIDPSSGLFGETFKLVLPELTGCPDFIVEKTRYDAAINRGWSVRDKCQVWWTSDTGEDGSWWEGRIVSSQAKSMEFPNSPWEKYEVEYTDGSKHHHSAWELHDPDYLWEHPHIDSETKNELLLCFNKAVSRNKDRYGFQKLNETAKKADFLNRFPVPLYPELIQARLENDYYRTLEAIEHDIGAMLSNAETYFSKSAEISSKVRRLSNLFTKVLSKLQEL